MKIDIRPNLDQIRFFAKSAMHAWDYQDLATGRAQAIADMEALLRYLDAINDGEGVVVAGVELIKAGVRVVRSTRKGNVFDLTDRYMAENVVCDVDEGDCRNASAGITEHRMGANGLLRIEDGDDNLGSGVDRPAKR
jgi:hypothetical protein